MVLLVLIGTIGILAYAGFLLDPSHRGDLLPYAMVITAETIETNLVTDIKEEKEPAMPAGGGMGGMGGMGF